MNGTELKRFRLGLGYESAQQLAEASGYKAQTLLAMECGSRNESVSLSNVKHCLDWTLICFVVKREALFRLDT